MSYYIQEVTLRNGEIGYVGHIDLQDGTRVEVRVHPDNSTLEEKGSAESLYFNKAGEERLSRILGFGITPKTQPNLDFVTHGAHIEEVIMAALLRLLDLSTKFPCRENSRTIIKLEEALQWQCVRRTKPNKDSERN